MSCKTYTNEEFINAYEDTEEAWLAFIKQHCITTDEALDKLHEILGTDQVNQMLKDN
jgi:hypothetical protein